MRFAIPNRGSEVLDGRRGDENGFRSIGHVDT